MSNPTRQKILATTSDLLERQGYHATGLNQIVKESSTPRGSLYYYFPGGKEELASEAVTQRMSEVAEHKRRFLEQIDDPIEAIYTMLMRASQRLLESECSHGAPIATIALEASNKSERIRQACATGYQKSEDVYAAKLVMGGFSAEKAARLASTINAAMEGGIILARTKQDATILANVANDMKMLLQSALEA